MSFFAAVKSEISIFPFSISLAKNSSKVKIFFAIFSADVLSSAKRIYSSLKVKIAEGSTPISGVLSVIISLKMVTLLLQIAFASFKNPFEIWLLPLSSCPIFLTS